MRGAFMSMMACLGALLGAFMACGLFMVSEVCQFFDKHNKGVDRLVVTSFGVALARLALKEKLLHVWRTCKSSFVFKKSHMRQTKHNSSRKGLGLAVPSMRASC